MATRVHGIPGTGQSQGTGLAETAWDTEEEGAPLFSLVTDDAPQGDVRLTEHTG
jgi:hypothetical protein